MLIRDGLARALTHGDLRLRFKLRRHPLARAVVLDAIENDPSLGEHEAGAAPDALKEALRKMFDSMELKLEANGRDFLLAAVQALEAVLLDAGVLDLIWELIFKT